MQTSALFNAINLGFFEIYGVSARTREEGVEPVRIFGGQGEVNFSRFCADVFCGRLLIRNCPLIHDKLRTIRCTVSITGYRLGSSKLAKNKPRTFKYRSP